MNDIQSLLELPTGTIAALAAGYLSYRLAYRDRDRAHRPTDVVFITLVFALVARAASTVAAGWVGELAANLSGVPAALLVAAGWRVAGAEMQRRLLRAMKVSYGDGFGNAWESVIGRQGLAPSQLIVRLKDGRALMTDHLRRFDAFRYGPCLLAADGSVGMYVTDRRAKDGDPWVASDILDPEHGTLFSYIPADEIAEIRLRLTD